MLSPKLRRFYHYEENEKNRQKRKNERKKESDVALCFERRKLIYRYGLNMHTSRDSDVAVRGSFEMTW